MTNVQAHVKKSDYLEIQTGKAQIEMEIRHMAYLEVANNKLVYSDKEEGKIIFEQYKNMIRKRTNKNGHQPIMMGISNVTFEEKNNIVQMEVTSLEEETYEYFIFP